MPRETLQRLAQQAFYRHVLAVLQKHKLPFLVGGDFALRAYTGIRRTTKNLDLFICPSDLHLTLQILAEAGYRTEVTDSHWLGKAFCKDYFVDLILGFANGIGQVDSTWFARSKSGMLFGIPVHYMSPDDMIWVKCFVQDRDRYDGADVAHLLLSCHDILEWKRMLKHFGSFWRVLLSHLILFGFIYPGERRKIPSWLMEELLRRLQGQLKTSGEPQLCQGTLLSMTQYSTDIHRESFRDARVFPATLSAHFSTDSLK